MCFGKVYVIVKGNGHEPLVAHVPATVLSRLCLKALWRGVTSILSEEDAAAVAAALSDRTLSHASLVDCAWHGWLALACTAQSAMCLPLIGRHGPPHSLS